MNYPASEQDTIQLLQAIARLTVENYTFRDMVVGLQARVAELEKEVSPPAE